jgi:hypothetical protein
VILTVFRENGDYGWKSESRHYFARVWPLELTGEEQRSSVTNYSHGKRNANSKEKLAGCDSCARNDFGGFDRAGLRAVVRGEGVREGGAGGGFACEMPWNGYDEE